MGSNLGYVWLDKYFRRRVFGNCQWIKNGFLHGITIENAKLSGAMLENVKLSGAILNNINLKRSYLVGVDFSYSQLSGVDLSDAKINGAIGKNEIIYTNLTNANLSKAIFKDAHISNTNFNGANLVNADLENVTFGCSFVDKINDCNNMRNIHWNEKTNWKGVKGWEYVINIPPELKKHLKLP
jgi:uncharacterized protein YjbI with pentapeptide repeats